MRGSPARRRHRQSLEAGLRRTDRAAVPGVRRDVGREVSGDCPALGERLDRVPCRSSISTPRSARLSAPSTIESVNARICRAVPVRGHFPNEQGALRCAHRAVMALDPTGVGRRRWTIRWSPARPHPARPHPARPHPARPHPARPHPARPHPARPHPARPHPARPHPAQPHPAQPHPAQPHPAQPHPAHPRGSPRRPLSGGNGVIVRGGGWPVDNSGARRAVWRIVGNGATGWRQRGGLRRPFAAGRAAGPRLCASSTPRRPRPGRRLRRR
jgi:hypothetical protein